MSYPHPSLSKVIDDESHYQEFDDPLDSDGSDFEVIAIVEAYDIFSDDDSYFSLTSVKISELNSYLPRRHFFFSDFTQKTNTTIYTLCLLTQQVITPLK